MHFVNAQVHIAGELHNAQLGKVTTAAAAAPPPPPPPPPQQQGRYLRHAGRQKHSSDCGAWQDRTRVLQTCAR